MPPGGQLCADRRVLNALNSTTPASGPSLAAQGTPRKSASGARLGGGDAHAASEQLEQARRHVPLALFRGVPAATKLGPDTGVVEFSAFSTVRSAHRCPPGGKGYYEVEILVLDHRPQFGFATAAFERVRGATGDGVGDDEHSWAVDGARQLKWHSKKQEEEEEEEEEEGLFKADAVNEEEEEDASFEEEDEVENVVDKEENDEEESEDEEDHESYECTWKEGDVVGLACDLERGQVLVAVNGSFAPPNGLVFELPPDAAAPGGLFAALTGFSGSVRCNLGASPFQHAPPSTDFTAFVHFQPE